MYEVWDNLESAIKDFEKNIAGRQFTAQERAKFEKWWRDTTPQRESRRLAHDPMARAQVTLDFMRRLKNRQGTIPPHF